MDQSSPNPNPPGLEDTPPDHDLNQPPLRSADPAPVSAFTMVQRARLHWIGGGGCDVTAPVGVIAGLWATWSGKRCFWPWSALARVVALEIDDYAEEPF